MISQDWYFEEWMDDECAREERAIPETTDERAKRVRAEAEELRSRVMETLLGALHDGRVTVHEYQRITDALDRMTAHVDDTLAQVEVLSEALSEF